MTFWGHGGRQVLIQLRDPMHSVMVSNWSQVASACSNLKEGFGSWPEIEVRPQRWKHQILTTKLVVSDKAPVLQLCRKELPQRWKVVKQVFIRRKRVHMRRHMDRLRETESLRRTLVVVWITFMGHFFQVSFGQSFWFAWFRAHI